MKTTYENNHVYLNAQGSKSEGIWLTGKARVSVTSLRVQVIIITDLNKYFNSFFFVNHEITNNQFNSNYMNKELLPCFSLSLMSISFDILSSFLNPQ
ncbi:hypothetical protein PUN28_007791 [Cardiocondyla obscurior]|uniref:Uncharacterized protein n=1 Tax=Cardiocondyla obscurior TaxID=286306 RepID=A0AAW2FWK9_9HYME